MLVADARAVVTPLLGATGRVLVGIAGPPGAGKSTLAQALVDSYADEVPSLVVPMDGFHLSNVELDRLGLADRKGAPETFDATGFVHLLQRLRAATELVYAPAYSRTLHESIGGVIAVAPSTRLVVVEGNYLLLPEPPWASVRGLLDRCLYLEVADDVRVPRLLTRQLEHGRSEDAAYDWVHRSDEANARLIATTRRYADAVLRPGETPTPPAAG
jgi:pantothenate kinase